MKLLRKNMKLKILFIFIVILFLLQFFQLKKTNPPIGDELIAPEEIQAILTKSCMDCHSNTTIWPWYTSVAPMNYFVVDHVNEGRHELNFSTFGSYTKKKQKKKLDEAVDEIKDGKMPLRSYVILHQSAKLSEKEKTQLIEWFSKTGDAIE